MNSFSFFLTIGVGLLFLSLLVANSNISDCGNNTITCPDGSIISADPLNNCFIPSCPHADLMRYCGGDIIWVESNGSIIRTISRLTGAGFTVYDSNVTSCPLVSPSHYSSACRHYDSLNWSVRIDCSMVDDDLVYHCPVGVSIVGNVSLINCSNPGFTDYCDSRVKQWVEHNCGVIIVK